MLAVQPLTTLQNALALIGRYPRPIVFNAQRQLPWRLFQAYPHLAQAQPVGVLQQVAKQLQQGALLHWYLRGLGDLQCDADTLIPIDFGQRAAQAVEQRLEQHAVAHQAALAQTGALQLIVDLLAHAFDLALQHPRLFALAAALAQALADPLQHRQRCLEAVRQVVQRVAIALTLLTFAVQQTVQRTGQAQQFTRVLAAQAVPCPRLDLVQLPAQPPQRTQPPGQAGPEQHQQRQQRGAKPQVELFAQAIEGVLVLAHRLQRNDAVGRALAAEQLDLDVIDEELIAIGLMGAGEFVATAVIAGPVVDVLVCSGP
ncbi:hypothetical protein D3C81_1167400 [compost metagenome]